MKFTFCESDKDYRQTNYETGVKGRNGGSGRGHVAVKVGFDLGQSGICEVKEEACSLQKPV